MQKLGPGGNASLYSLQDMNMNEALLHQQNEAWSCWRNFMGPVTNYAQLQGPPCLCEQCWLKLGDMRFAQPKIACLLVVSKCQMTEDTLAINIDTVVLLYQ